MRLEIIWAFGAVTLFGLTSLHASAQVPLHPHHHLHHALWELRDARKELKNAAHDFGGHRVKALAAVDAAIKQLDIALKNAGDNIKGAPTRGDLQEEYKKYKHHPHLHHALHELRHAAKQLEEAKHDFGGHRAAALRDVNHAIRQLELCLKFHKKP
jgi:hypothetical protein